MAGVINGKVFIKPIIKFIELAFLISIVCLFVYDGPPETNGYLTFTNGDINDWFNFCIVVLGAFLILTSLFFISYIIRENAIMHSFHEVTAMVIGAVMHIMSGTVIFSYWTKSEDNSYRDNAMTMGGLSVAIGFIFLFDGAISFVLKRRMEAMKAARLEAVNKAASERKLVSGQQGGSGSHGDQPLSDDDDASPKSTSRL